jgi:hypothetical protein
MITMTIDPCLLTLAASPHCALQREAIRAIFLARNAVLKMC